MRRDTSFLIQPVELDTARVPWDPGPQSLLRDQFQVPGPRRPVYSGVGLPVNPQAPFLFPTPQWNAEAHRYAYPTDMVFVYGLASLLMLAAPPTFRNYLMLRNLSTTQSCFIANGGVASASSPIQLFPTQMMLFDSVVPQLDLNVVGTGAGSIAIAVSTVPLPPIPPSS